MFLRMMVISLKKKTIEFLTIKILPSNRYINNMTSIYTDKASKAQIEYIPSLNISSKIILLENTRVNFIQYNQSIGEQTQHINTLNLVYGALEISYLNSKNSRELFFLRYKDNLIIPKKGSIIYFSTGVLNDDFVVIALQGSAQIINNNQEYSIDNRNGVESKNNRFSNFDVVPQMETSKLYIWQEQQEKRMSKDFIKEYERQLSRYVF